MKIVENIKTKILERKLASAYKECCRGLYSEYRWNNSPKFVPVGASFHFPKMDVYNYYRLLKDRGYDSKDVLLKAAREMDSRVNRYFCSMEFLM